MGIWVLPTANSLDVIKAVRAELPRSGDSRRRMNVGVPYDSTEYINDALHEVTHTLIETLIKQYVTERVSGKGNATPAPSKERFGIHTPISAYLSAGDVRRLADLVAICPLSDRKDSQSGTASPRRAPVRAPALLTAAARINIAQCQALAELTAIAGSARR